MSKKVLSRQHSKAVPLTEQVQREPLKQAPDSPLYDVEDNDLWGYLSEFLSSYSELEPLGPTSLMTREDALKALKTVEEASRKVQSHMRTARALKNLFQNKSPEQSS